MYVCALVCVCVRAGWLTHREHLDSDPPANPTSLAKSHETSNQFHERGFIVSCLFRCLRKRLHGLGIPVLGDGAVVEESDRMTINRSGLKGCKRWTLKAWHQAILLHKLGHLQYPSVATKHASLSPLETSALRPALHEEAQLGHPRVNRSIPVQ